MKKMKKIQYIAIAVMALAGLASCQRHDMPGVAGTPALAPLYLNVSASDNATKVAFAEGEELSLTARWEAGDSLSVIYFNGTQLVNEKFTIVDSTITPNGKRGVFFCPSSGAAALEQETTFTIIYPYTSTLEGGDYTVSIAAQEGTLAALGGKNVMSHIFTGRSLTTDVILEQHISILRFPKGLMTVTGLTDENATLVLSKGGGSSDLASRFKAGSGNAVVPEAGSITVTGVKLDEGMLREDLYVAFAQDTAGSASQLQLDMTVTGGGKSYPLQLPQRDFAAGRVYTIKDALKPVMGPHIYFKDTLVRKMCVAAGWDTDTDGHISAAEAAAVSAAAFTTTFAGSEITSFDELVHFTGLTMIPSGAFGGCSRLRSVVLPGSVTQIGQYAFRNCASLVEITLPAAVTTIMFQPFINCTSLARVNIESSSFELGSAAFVNCPSLTEFNSADPAYFVAERCMMKKEGTDIILNSYLGDETGPVVAPGVTVIAGQAFSKSINITRVTLPASLKKLQQLAFAEHDKLDTVKFCSADLPVVEKYAFYETVPKVIIAPHKSLKVYREATQWGGATVVGYALLPSGLALNAIIKRQAAPSASSATMDRTIRKIRFSADDFTVSGNNIAASGTELPIYASYDEASATVTISTPASEFCTGSDASSMFAFFNRLEAIENLSRLETDDAVNMEGMFNQYGADTSMLALRELDLSGFNTANVTSFRSMFNTCSKLEKLDLTGFNTASATSFAMMFCRCEALSDLRIGSFVTASATTMYGMFYDCSSLRTLDVSSFTTEAVTDMSYMFKNCKSLKSLDLSRFNTAKVTNMDNMFGDNEERETLLLGAGFTTASVTNMRGLFQNNRKMQTFDHQFDVSSCTNLAHMFAGCSSILSLDLRSFDLSSATVLDCMFHRLPSLLEMKLSASFLKSSVSDTWFFCSKEDAFPERTASLSGQLTIHTVQAVADWLAKTDLRWVKSGYEASSPIPVVFRHATTGSTLTVNWKAN